MDRYLVRTLQEQKFDPDANFEAAFWVLTSSEQESRISDFGAFRRAFFSADEVVARIEKVFRKELDALGKVFFELPPSSRIAECDRFKAICAGSPILLRRIERLLAFAELSALPSNAPPDAALLSQMLQKLASCDPKNVSALRRQYSAECQTEFTRWTAAAKYLSAKGVPFLLLDRGFAGTWVKVPPVDPSGRPEIREVSEDLKRWEKTQAKSKRFARPQERPLHEIFSDGKLWLTGFGSGIALFGIMWLKIISEKHIPQQASPAVPQRSFVPPQQLQQLRAAPIRESPPPPPLAEEISADQSQPVDSATSPGSP